MTRKVATIRISAEMLREVLCIPADVELEYAAFDQGSKTAFFVLRGEGLPDACEADGPVPAELVGTFFRDNEQEIVSSVTWKVKA